MNNKEVVKQFIENLFVNNEKAYASLADNVRVNWPGYGLDTIEGKQNLQSFLSKGGPDKVLHLTINNLVEEGDIVIGDGTITTERKGKIETSHYADVYTMKNGKISQLRSYMVFDKNNDKM